MGLTEDYVLRQLKTVAAMLARIAGLRLDGSPDEARLELEQAYGLLIGEKADLVRRLDPPTAAKLLGTSGKMLMMARLLVEEAELGGGDGLRQRAVALVREALQRDPDSEEAKNLLAEWNTGVDRT